MSEKQRHGREIITIPLPCLLSVIRFGVCWGAGDGIQIPPSASALSVQLPLLLFRELLVWDEFFQRIAPRPLQFQSNLTIKNTYSVGDLLRNRSLHSAFGVNPNKGDGT